MRKKFFLFSCVVFLIMNAYGCLMFTAELAEKENTLSYDFSVPYVDLLNAIDTTFRDLGLACDKTSLSPTSTSIKGIYTDGKSIHLTVEKMTEQHAHIEIRVGTSETGKSDARTILDAIKERANQEPPRSDQPAPPSEKG